VGGEGGVGVGASSHCKEDIANGGLKPRSSKGKTAVAGNTLTRHPKSGYFNAGSRA
jgi:hypothetical protein